MTPIDGFIGGAFQSRGAAVRGNVADTTLVNLLAEKDESGSRNALVSRPGLTNIFQVSGKIRGALNWEEHVFFVAGSILYEHFEDGSNIVRGSGLDDDGLVCQMFQNGDQLFIVTGGYGWIYQGGVLKRAYIRNGDGVVNTSGTSVTWVSGDQFTSDMANTYNLIVINSGNYSVATYVGPTGLTLASTAGVQTSVGYQAYLPLKAVAGGFLGGYFLAVEPTSGGTPTATDGKLVRFSNLRDGVYYDPLDYFVKEGQPDNIVGLLVDHEEAFVFGARSTEVYRATGSANTFDRDPSGFLQLGCAAKATPCSMGGAVYFLSGDTRGRVMATRLRGFQPERISNSGLEALWATYYATDKLAVQNASAYSYEESGHSLWVVQFPVVNKTWVFDAATGLWSEWRYWNGSSSEKYLGMVHVFCWNKHLVGDFEANGRLHQSSFTITTDLLNALQYERQFRVVTPGAGRMRHHVLALDVETGTVPSGSAPSLSLTWSDNDGGSYVTARTASLGAAGVKALRVLWRRLGQTRDRIYRISVTTTAPQAWVMAYLTGEKDAD